MISAGIDYNEHGAGEPVVFLHGIGGGAASFDHQLRALAGYRCIAWNMPGYGASNASLWPPTFASLSASLAEFIDSLQLGRVHLVGQSIGGMLALEHAVRAPEQIGTLTLIANTPSFGGRDESFKQSFLEARLGPLNKGLSMADVAAAAAPALVGPGASMQTISEIETILASVSEVTWRGILECLVTFNRRDSLASITQPCCVIAGSHDANAPAKTMQKMSDALGAAEFHIVENAGHMVNQEKAELTNQYLTDFFGKHHL